MGRRRWRFITIAAFLFYIGGIQCQDEDNFYYTPVERSFAQVQPSLFSNNRPATFFNEADSIRIGPPSQQSIYGDGQLRVPGPNYNQNPSPFQVPTGRSQSGSQFYINQPEFGTLQKQRFKPALPHNYQFIQTTKRPDLSQIHSAVYQNDPSRPETFLGQITINNPDVDYLQNNRFKNTLFDGNSLKINGQTGHIVREEDIDNDELDLFEQHKVTTFNPNKLVYTQSQYNVKPNGARFSHFASLSEPKKSNSPNITSKTKVATKQINSPVSSINLRYQSSSTEYKALLDLQPLLEDDLTDSSLKELMENTKKSDDVQVIKSDNSRLSDSNDDNKPDASSMNANNFPNSVPQQPLLQKETNVTNYSTTEHEKAEETDENDSSQDNDHSDDHEDPEYEYYEDDSNYTITESQSTEHPDIYDEYDATEDPEHNADDHESIIKEDFDVLLTKSNNTMVKDDNFKQFIDTTVIDQPEIIHDSKSTDTTTSSPLNMKDLSLDAHSILGQEVVSVVTTKSVVNGTISVPHVTFAPTEKVSVTTESFPSSIGLENNDTNLPVTTDNWVVVASVQTSRSISGARFLPFPTVEQEEKKQVITDEDEEENDDEQNLRPDTLNIKSDSKPPVNSSSSTENINDKLDSIQSELSSAVLSGTLDSENKNIELIPEYGLEQNVSADTTTASPLNLFTLKSTQSLPITELSSPEPLPVMIKKFTPRAPLFTTPKPKRKSSLVTVADNLDGLLPSGYRTQSYKDKRTSTTSTTTTTTTSTTPKPLISTEENIMTGPQGRFLGMSSKNKVILLDDKSLLPKEYIPKESKVKDGVSKQIQDDDINKFLPPGYKEQEFELPETKTTTKPNILDKVKEVDVSSFLPKDFNLGLTSTEKPISKAKIFSKIQEVDISSFLPKNYNISTASKEKPNILDEIQDIDVSKFLPKDFNLSTATTDKPKTKPKFLSKIKEDKISDLLPKDFILNETTVDPNLKPTPKSLDKIKEIDISALLPKNYNSSILPVSLSALLPTGYKLNETDDDNIENPKMIDVSNSLSPGSNDSENSVATSTTTRAPGDFRPVLPKRPGGKRKTTSKPERQGPSPVTPKIQKGWPSRATTEFTGWPSPSTTPLSIDKLSESSEKNAASASSLPDWNYEFTSRAVTTTTTTTTQAPPPSTTPGICIRECEIAATIKIVEGVKWIPELQDPHTEEWQKLAKDVKDELNSVYSTSDLSKWYKNIHIDSFSKGSVLVDYFIELNDIEGKIDTLELKKLFHQSLTQAKPTVVVEPEEEKPTEGSVDPDVMLGDQPEEFKMKKSNERMTKTLDKTSPKLEIGKFVMDPAYTEFIVVQKHEEPKEEVPEEESVLPQWGIAVIVIAMASLLFVVIFGVTVLVNRQKNTKMKQPIPLSEDMLRELDKNHMGGFEDSHQLKERDLPYLPSGKRMSTAFIEQLAYPNPGDSWRSEWTPQMQKYMQHYATDSGRGTQLYGPTANIYGYSGSQIYGHTGGGSQVYGYTGEYPRSHHSRRRSEYDSNF